MVDTDLDAQTEATKREGRGPSRAGRNERLERGAVVGRYVVLRVVGSGGMGVVYSAYDPELDRKVAIKLLETKATGSGAEATEAWLVREAQAMARLSHPNVLAVHDVGTLEGGRVFVAMELVEGRTLRQWIRADQRTWRTVIEVMAAAGEGLAAAHAVALVHRDFKPDNVLVGNDGRVRVMDFGLAHLGDGDPNDPDDVDDRPASRQTPISETLTFAGSVVGTPAYMAPELHRGEAADERSDQFAFGVSLYEALAKQRPFAKDARGVSAPPPLPAKAGVPQRIHRIVMRALAFDREQRFGSMRELIDQLTTAARRDRRPLLIGGAVAAAIAVPAVAYVVTRPDDSATGPVSPAASQLCKGAERRLAGVWDDGLRTKVRAAFVATERSFAGQAFASVERTLDGWAKEWTVAATEACEATRIRGELSEEVLGRRQACLDRRLGEVRAVIDLLASADAKLIEQADHLGRGLEPLERCADIAALLAPNQPPSEPAREIDELFGQLAAAKANITLARPFAAIESTGRAIALAEKLKYEPFRTEALLVRGAALGGIGNLQDAHAVFVDAVWSALGSDRFDFAAQSAISLILIGFQHRVNDGAVWSGLAHMALRKIGGNKVFELRLMQAEAAAAGARGDGKTASDAALGALALAERLYGATNPGIWNDLEAAGVALATTGAWQKARPHFERALALRERTVGGDHPDIAAILTNLGACYSKTGDDAQARAAYQRAVAIRERTDGKNSPYLILTLNNMADGMIKAGDHANALAYSERATTLAERVLGKGNQLYHAVVTTHAEALAAARRDREARKAFDDVIALEAVGKSAYLGPTLGARALFECSREQWRACAGFAERSIGAIEAASGDQAADLIRPLHALARAKVALRRAGDARPLLERALAIGDKAGVVASELTAVRALLAQLKT